MLRTKTLLMAMAWGLLASALRAAESPGQPMIEAITSIGTLLNAKDPSAFSGHRVILTNVPVQRILNPQVLLVGPEKGRELVVRLEEPLPGLKPGQPIRLTGIINQMLVQPQGWDLDTATFKSLRKHRIFLNATEAAPERKRQTPATPAGG